MERKLSCELRPAVVRPGKRKKQKRSGTDKWKKGEPSEQEAENRKWWGRLPH